MFFVGDFTSSIGLAFLAEVIRPWTQPPDNFLTQVFSGNYTKIRVFWAFDLVSSISC